ncbi:FeoA family protein [Oribacterium sp. HCP28S3_H8]|jgi:ferrous iron transport protein A|uniref:FeoA family protein n=1 Tax=Oribacterium sp. HCP28S3_H8 TaxID=3438945 RepID=UPI003035546F|nr:FeoA family protein [Oribacterium sp.]
MPLSLCGPGEYQVMRITGDEKIRQHLEALGFTPGSSIRVISKNGSNLIVQVKESRLAIDGTMAKRIMV